MTQNRLALTSAILMALGAAATTAQAAEVEVSGQVSRAIIIPDDAAGTTIQHVDNNVSGTRFRFKAKQDIGNDMMMAMRYEMQMQNNKGNAVNGGSTGSAGNKFDVRYSDIYLSGGFGKVSMGKGDGAANGSTEEDLSGTYMPAAANMMDVLGGIEYEPGKKVGSVYAMYDAYSRNNRLRYDSPKFSGFSLAASSDEGDATEFALRYSGKFGDTKVKAAAFVASAGDSSRKDTSGGSVSVLLGMGFNATVAFSTEDATTGDDPSVVWTKLGYRTGKHSFSIDAGTTKDRGPADADTLGVAYTIRPAKGIEVYASYRQFTVDTNASVDPTLFLLGSRFKF